jgi:gamma-glutamylcysteine synthetase
VNREELNWLLQTIKDPETAERFVLAQYQRGRISPQLMADVAQERDWINHAANQFMTMTTRRNNECATTELTVAFA